MLFPPGPLSAITYDGCGDVSVDGVLEGDASAVLSLGVKKTLGPAFFPFFNNCFLSLK